MGLEVERDFVRRQFSAMRLQIPNRAGGLVSRREFNGAIETLEASIPRGLAHKTTRGVIPRRVARAAGGAAAFEHPLQVYLSGGYICVRAGHHVWFDSYANAPAQTDLEKDVGDAWQAYTTGARTVYVKRTYNSDGTATVELMNTADNFSTVRAGITNTEARWILATIADGVITQWWTGGDIYELRVA